jgi:hypothetical protein
VGRAGKTTGRGQPPADRATPTGEGGDEEGGGGRGRGGPQTAAMALGLQRFNWDLQYQPVVTFPGMVLWGATTNGPTAVPGTFQARLTVDGRSQTQSFMVKKHPWHTGHGRRHARAVRSREPDPRQGERGQQRDHPDPPAQTGARRSDEEVAERGREGDRGAIHEGTGRVEEDVYQVRNQSNQDPLNFPIKTNNRLASLLRVVLAGDGKPTANTGPIFEDLKVELKAETDRLQRALTTYIPRFNTLASGWGWSRSARNRDSGSAIRDSFAHGSRSRSSATSDVMTLPSLPAWRLSAMSQRPSLFNTLEVKADLIERVAPHFLQVAVLEREGVQRDAVRPRRDLQNHRTIGSDAQHDVAVDDVRRATRS